MEARRSSGVPRDKKRGRKEKCVTVTEMKDKEAGQQEGDREVAAGKKKEVVV